ncbi:MAG TPA: alpha/beta fold hydrolase, partial [Solirubrobacteraceae bacterium]|nr:alpha/beta fold hydrolase [Solirubrobacteraceae bacterium]
MVDTTTAAQVWTSGAVAVGERRLRFWETGNGTPLVILHGGGGVDLAPAYERLALQARVICLELPGFGDDPSGPAAPDTFPAVASTVIEATAELGMDRFALLGVSFGGATA